MKRTITAILIFTILALVLSGCSSDNNSDTELDPVAHGAEPAISDEIMEPANDVDGTGRIIDAEQALPDTQWVFDTPENHNMDGQQLNTMHTVLENTSIMSALTVKDGVVVDEFYQSGYGESSVFRFNSGSKSITSALIGIAIDEGLIESVDVRISEFFPQLAGSDKEEITIRHLLEHTSGLEWYEFGGSAVSFWELNNSEHWVNYVLARPLVATPGSTFNYSTGGTHLLGAILEQASEESMIEYARRHLFVPLGMDSVHWRIDPQGIPDAGNGIEMTARDAAKFGQLFLNGGRWGDHQLVPEAWVTESTSVQVVRNGTTNGSYGYQWWILPLGGYDTWYALGAGGQFILVVPELDLVTVMTCDGDTNAPYAYISDYIIAACN